MPASRFAKPVRALAALMVAGLLVFTGYALYARTDWAVAADPPVNPALLWGECLRAGKPAALGAQQPGISPGSRLYFHPRVDGAESDRVLAGWEFYGEVAAESGTVSFSCATDALGKSVRWAP